ncbi:MAG: SatD family protein [Actinomycetia bacterium]|nr:SatD family protein [Actinomycetes bacterium]
MAQMKPSTADPTATLIADLVASRTASDRQHLHDRFRAAMEAVNTDPKSGLVEPLRITVGDEFQGRFATVGAALAATLQLRLALSPADIRFGVSWGQTRTLDAEGTQDGPAWWDARAAIEWVQSAEKDSATEQVRTRFLSREASGPGAAQINAALLCRDHLVGSLDDRSQRVLGGLMAGHTQAQIAAAEQISPSAISQRIRRDGLGLILLAHEELRAVR